MGGKPPPGLQVPGLKVLNSQTVLAAAIQAPGPACSKCSCIAAKSQSLEQGACHSSTELGRRVHCNDSTG